MNKLAAALVLTLTLASPAFAHDCPNLMAQIDEALATMTVDQAVKDQVMALYEKGKAEHEAGDHDASVASLTEALALLGM